MSAKKAGDSIWSCGDALRIAMIGAASLWGKAAARSLRCGVRP